MNDYSEMRKCTVCGKMFDPIRYNQLTCSAECSRIRNCERVKENYKKNKNKTVVLKVCTICGKPIDYDKERSRRYARMHEDCVINDLLDTVRSGHKLADKQYNRMIARALSTKDLIQMIAREKESETMRDMW